MPAHIFLGLDAVFDVKNCFQNILEADPVFILEAVLEAAFDVWQCELRCRSSLPRRTPSLAMPQLVLSAAEKADGEALIMYLLAEAADGDDAEAREFAEETQEMYDGE